MIETRKTKAWMPDKESKHIDERVFEPMTEKELNRRIEQSESDFRNNRFKNSSELLTMYEL